MEDGERYEIIKINGRLQRVRVISLGKKAKRERREEQIKRDKDWAEIQKRRLKHGEIWYQNKIKNKFLDKMAKRKAWAKNKSKSFYYSEKWRCLRLEILRRYGYACLACGRKQLYGAKLHVDHIKPRSIYPELELDPENLQVLCEHCNIEKGTTIADFRKPIPYRRGIK